jgi:hypothetical protein
MWLVELSFWHVENLKRLDQLFRAIILLDADSNSLKVFIPNLTPFTVCNVVK